MCEILGYHETPVRVQFGHVDGYGFLWHGHALSYFEVARASVVRPFGMSAVDLLEAGLAVPMVDLDCQFKNTAYDDEELVIQSTLCKPDLPLPYIDFLYRVIRKEDDAEILRGRTRQMLIRKDGRVLIRIPNEVRESMNDIWEYLSGQPKWPD